MNSWTVKFLDDAKIEKVEKKRKMTQQAAKAVQLQSSLVNRGHSNKIIIT